MSLSNGPVVEAHRGDSENAPENTLAAFKQAMALAVEWIELDVHPTRDGRLVVLHDSTVDRTTDGSGPVAEMSSAEVRELDAGSWFAPEFAGERVPTLEETVELTALTPTRLNIEVKDAPGIEAVAREVAGLLRRAGCEREYVVSSFDSAALNAVRKVAPEITLALIGNGPEILDRARSEGIPWIHANWTTAYPDVVGAAHAHGIKVNIWTMDDPALYAHWRRRGVDKLCTNRPARMLAAAVAPESIPAYLAP
ncbi:MAG: glycerophosphodiester phosphodiesterase [Kiritimatiellaeota bacterium]|nr:glycerophosphodiester phosphodiesterase [Kiritimatiellota bacterium]